MPEIKSEAKTQTRSSARVGRRAALALAATGACGAAALAAPSVVSHIQADARDLERKALLHEIGQLEGVSLDAAIAAAELTRAAVKVIVLPVAQLVALIGTAALTVLISTMDNARNAADTFHVTVPWLAQVRTMFATWRDGVIELPISLDAYATADIGGAERYLKALKTHLTAQ